jgi:putative ABC transport system permease protein
MARERSAEFFQTLLERLSAAPDISSAAVFTWGIRDPFSIQGRPFDPASASTAFHRVISPGYFQTMGIPVTGGRDFSRGDSSGAQGVMMFLFSQSADLGDRHQNGSGR